MNRRFPPPSKTFSVVQDWTGADAALVSRSSGDDLVESFHVRRKNQIANTMRSSVPRPIYIPISDLVSGACSMRDSEPQQESGRAPSTVRRKPQSV
jgi:hypothetical protein